MSEQQAELDAGALAKVIVGHQRIPMYGHIPGLQRCSGGCSDLLAESDGPNSPRHALHVAEQILTSDWLAAHDARAKESAWDEGWDTGQLWAFSDLDEHDRSTNPYRADRIEGTR
jgi:hypothetical protein